MKKETIRLLMIFLGYLLVVSIGFLYLYPNINADTHTENKNNSKSTSEGKHTKANNLSSDNKDEKVLVKEDEVNAFRNRLHIKAKGENIPNPSPTFHQMSIDKEIKSVILKNIEESKWKDPTPIQMQSIPIMLNKRDILAAAPTGSGKTASYVIPVLSRLAKPLVNNGVRALLLAPTKELADQIFHEIQRLGHGKKFKICNLKKNIMHQATNEGVRPIDLY